MKSDHRISCLLFPRERERERNLLLHHLLEIPVSFSSCCCCCSLNFVHFIVILSSFLVIKGRFSMIASYILSFFLRFLLPFLSFYWLFEDSMSLSVKRRRKTGITFYCTSKRVKEKELKPKSIVFFSFFMLTSSSLKLFLIEDSNNWDRHEECVSLVSAHNFMIDFNFALFYEKEWQFDCFLWLPSNLFSFPLKVMLLLLLYHLEDEKSQI